MKLESMKLTERTFALRELLINNECEVTFTKVDGTKRVMPCTLDPKRLPVVKVTESKREKTPNDQVLSVFCTDKNEWRSFRIMNAEEIRVIAQEDFTE